MQLERIWRSYWLRLPFSLRLPLRDLALALEQRLCALGGWLNLMTVGSAVEGFDVLADALGDWDLVEGGE